jgi:predicted nucleic acid-binding protein
MTHALIDTNVLVYAYDRTAGDKQVRARDVLDRLAGSGRGVLTAQVLAEFFVAVTRKLTIPLSPSEARSSLDNYLRAWPVLDVTGLIVSEAARGVDQHTLSYWDAQIWATARLNQISLILSEDFNSEAVIEGVRFENPFDPAFVLDAWLP